MDNQVADEESAAGTAILTAGKCNPRRSGEERKGQGKTEDGDEDVEHPLLGILRTDLHHFFGTFGGSG